MSGTTIGDVTGATEIEMMGIEMMETIGVGIVITVRFNRCSRWEDQVVVTVQVMVVQLAVRGLQILHSTIMQDRLLEATAAAREQSED
jgi:hypothetical protein